MIKDNKKYEKKLIINTSTIYTGEKAPRGNIYDRNGILLVGNKKVSTLIYNKNSETINKEIELAKIISENIEIENKVTVDNIKEYIYTKDYIILENKLSESIKNKYKQRIIDEKEYKEEILKLIDNSLIENLSEKEKLCAYIYALMNKDYSYNTKVIKKELTDKEIEYINNEKINGFSVSFEYVRYYPYGNVFREFLGNIGKIPKEDLKLNIYKGYNINDEVGISFLEKEYEYFLKGKNQLYTLNAKGEKTIIQNVEKGNDLVISIDIELQKEINEIVFEELVNAKKENNTSFLNKAFVVISNPKTGEILASTNIIINKDNDTYNYYENLSSLINYGITPGSSIKAVSHSVGYKYNAINIGTKITDSCIVLKNTPLKCSWMRLGTVDDINALRVSSNYYQFITSIKVSNGYYKPGTILKLDNIGFKRYRDMFNSYGLGVKTGIDIPNENIGVKGNDQNVSSILDFSIGQYDTYTPLSMIQYINTVASDGQRIKLSYLKEVYDNYENKDKKLLFSYEPKVLNKVDLEEKYISRIKLGLKEVLYNGTGKGHIDLKYKPSGKTGTAETYYNGTQTLSSSFVGYAPYDNPTFSIFTSTIDVTNLKTSYKSLVNTRITKKVSDAYFNKYN